MTDIRIASRPTQGVRVFHTAQDEHVVSVERITEEEAEEEDDGSAGDEADGDAGDSDE